MSKGVDGYTRDENYPCHEESSLREPVDGVTMMSECPQTPREDSLVWEVVSGWAELTTHDSEPEGFFTVAKTTS